MSIAGAPRIRPDRILQSIEERTITPWPDCRLWANAMDRGYGRVSIGGTVHRVHRVVWELLRGPIPDAMTIDHLCRVRNCVNVEHMELVTQSENTLRSIPYRPGSGSSRSGKERSTVATHCPKGHEYTPENTLPPGAGRKCRACAKERRRRGYARAKAARQERIS